MRIGFSGTLEDKPEIRAGFIGCGSHSFRNIYPTFQFAPVKLVATCDVDVDKAKAFAAKFGAERAYAHHHEMLEAEQLDAVFIVTGYDADGRPQFARLAADCLRAGVHAWVEKPPAATSQELLDLQHLETETGKMVMVGLKKMFFPANMKLKAISQQPSFGRMHCLHVKYPQHVPDLPGMADLKGNPKLIGFLDHLCHPASLMVYLAGPAKELLYERSAAGAAVVTVRFAGGAVGSLLLSAGQPRTCPLERTEIVGEGESAVAENNVRVFHYRQGEHLPSGYGRTPDYFAEVQDAVQIWEPEFSLGQLYNKGLFLLGYYGEVAEFARAVLEHRRPVRSGLDDAIEVTRWFEAMRRGPGRWQAIG